MSRHPLNASVNDRMERDPKTVLLIDALVNGRISPTIDLCELADHPELRFEDRYQALAYMRHACRIIVDREKFTLLLVTYDTQVCLGQVDRARGETQDECGFALSKIAADYVRKCAATNDEIESLDIIAMPLGQYQAEHGRAVDQYGVSLGSYPSDYLEVMQAALSPLVPDAA
jgi:hypothetical protein